MSVKLTDAFYVRIKDDADLVSAFLKWSLDNRIFPVRYSGGYSGRGGYGYTHEGYDKAAIEKFFKDYKKANRKPKA